MCQSVYSLGVTRRCLEDGHIFCSRPKQATSDSPSVTSESRSPSPGELARKSKEERRKRKRRPRQECRSEFDYAGWKKYYAWRREIQAIQAEKHGSSLINKDQTTPNCWMECTFPSECHNTRLDRLRAMRNAVELSSNQPYFSSQECEIQREAAEVEAQILDMLEFVTPVETLSLPSCSQEGDLEVEQSCSDGETNSVDVSVAKLEAPGVEDEMGPKEVEFVQKKRKKSLQKIRQLTELSLGTVTEAMELDANPPSPLKVQFAPEDLEDVDIGKMKTKKLDPQMEELLRTRSDYLQSLTTIERNEELFGDEEITIF